MSNNGKHNEFIALNETIDNIQCTKEVNKLSFSLATSSVRNRGRHEPTFDFAKRHNIFDSAVQSMVAATLDNKPKPVTKLVSVSGPANGIVFDTLLSHRDWLKN